MMIVVKKILLIILYTKINTIKIIKDCKNEILSPVRKIKILL